MYVLQFPSTPARHGAMLLLGLCALGSLKADPGQQDDGSAAADPTALQQLNAVLISSPRSTRSATMLAGSELQRTLPGTNPLKALQVLPGVLFTSSDPWGNNEQNASLFVHGFNAQQLGYTLDGIPLGDQQYGNYNGLSPQRAIISENLSSATLASGAADLPTASTSNLGGAITLLSSAPAARSGLRLQQTLGSHHAQRSFVRYDSGALAAGGTAFYLALARQRQQAWDFDGRQGGHQFNAKLTHSAGASRWTLFYNYADKIEPNEDPVFVGSPAGQGLVLPYTRPYLYPDFKAALAYLDANGNTPAAQGNNYSNYYSAAQRRDHLSYLKLDTDFDTTLHASHQIYLHRNEGAGLVAGPITAAGLPQLFGLYFPGQNLKQVFGGSGYATRTTEFEIKRAGLLSRLDWTLGQHDISAGLWLELFRNSAIRRWYGLDINAPSSPYQRPSQPLITQYDIEINAKVLQAYIQDQWQISPNLLLQAGVKSSNQHTRGWVPVQPLPGSTLGVSSLPEGRLKSSLGLLPQAGLLWQLSRRDELFVNLQKNGRQFVASGGGGTSPWVMGSQAAFESFKGKVAPETAWTYELGLRSKRTLSLGPLSGMESQLSVYRVDFSNRLLSVSPTPDIAAIVGGAPIIRNVGGVSTFGVDLSGKFQFGPSVSLFQALSYNRSTYDSNYSSGTATVPTAGKQVPGMPKLMSKSILSLRLDRLAASLSAEYTGKRYATYTNDLFVGSKLLLGVQASCQLGAALLPLHDAQLSLQISNLADARGTSTLGIGAVAGSYTTFPIAPRQFFLTLSAALP